METQVYIPTEQGLRIIAVTNIVRIEARSNYSKLFFDNAKPLTVAKVLHWFEDKLERRIFCRIHKTHIVNNQFISAISADNNTLTLLTGEQLTISRRRKRAVLKLLI